MLPRLTNPTSLCFFPFLTVISRFSCNDTQIHPCECLYTSISFFQLSMRTRNKSTDKQGHSPKPRARGKTTKVYMKHKFIFRQANLSVQTVKVHTDRTVSVFKTK